MVNLGDKPFFLNQEQIEWVENTIMEMTLEEKLSQLMILLDAGRKKDDDAIRKTLERSRQGGLRWQGGNAEEVYFQNTTYQKHSEIPLLIACNCDDGGNGALPEGTFVATAAEAAADGSGETAYAMGLVAAREAGSVGCNWMFNPVTDIYMNWRNTIVNTRCFGDNADTVIHNARAFIRGVRTGNPDMACCCKHFPGDGVEELDQHLVLGINGLSVDRWNTTFGKVYENMIADGIESIMIGHFAFPAMSRALRPAIKDAEIMPATLAPEIITDLLRGRLGFNGVVVTDATHMVGFAAVMRRGDALPQAIASGCDMILFANDLSEDLRYLKDGYTNGIITEERLGDALRRILGLKAKLKLNDRAACIPPASLRDKWVGCPEHKSYTVQAAERCVTLVKDSRNYLPIDPEKQKRAMLVYVQSTPVSKGYNGDPVKDIVIEELEKAGFAVTAAANFHDLEAANGPSPGNFGEMRRHGSREAFRAEYDVVFVVLNIKGYAQENNVRVRWSCSHSNELPWYIPEVPTIGISLNYTNHLIDVPQLKAFVNAYGSCRENIRAAVGRICGRSEFKGTASETVFCGRWETRL